MFWNKTVDQLLADFTNVINKLNLRAEYHALESGKSIAKAEQLQVTAKAHLSESARAALIATRLAKLVQV